MQKCTDKHQDSRNKNDWSKILQKSLPRRKHLFSSAKTKQTYFIHCADNKVVAFNYSSRPWQILVVVVVVVVGGVV